MKPIDPVCPECGGAMQEGFLLDQRYGGQDPATWVAGPPEKSFWTVTKVKGKARWRLTSYRCTACGLVKFYARDKDK